MKFWIWKYFPLNHTFRVEAIHSPVLENRTHCKLYERFIISIKQKLQQVLQTYTENFRTTIFKTYIILEQFFWHY